MTDQLLHIKADLKERMHGKEAVPIEFGYCAWLITEVERLRERVSIIEEVEATNRSFIEECKRVNADNERLRRIEDGALTSISEMQRAFGRMKRPVFMRSLQDAIEANPRPKETDDDQPQP